MKVQRDASAALHILSLSVQEGSMTAQRLYSSFIEARLLKSLLTNLTLATQHIDSNASTLKTHDLDVLRLLVATVFPYDDEDENDDEGEHTSKAIPSQDDKILLHACPAVLLAAKHLNDEAEEAIRHRAHLCMRRLSRTPKFANALLNKGVMQYLVSLISSTSGISMLHFDNLYQNSK